MSVCSKRQSHVSCSESGRKNRLTLEVLSERRIVEDYRLHGGASYVRRKLVWSFLARAAVHLSSGARDGNPDQPTEDLEIKRSL